jgi:LPXTG-motif cell wall-anchored protein
MQIKIGKVTDTSILQKIKNKDASGFSGLMSFAKSNKGLFDETVSADKDDSFAIEYNAASGSTKGNSVLNVKGIEDGQYYYLYVKTDSENGKYVSNEAVTLAKGDFHTSYALFFYGASDFKWTDWGNSTTDNTVAPTVLPNTGASIAVVLTIMGLVALGTIGGVKIYKYKDIK